MNKKRTPEIESETTETLRMSLLLTKDTRQNMPMNKQKCKCYDKGYCKHKERCQLYHPKTECMNQCMGINTCPYRHRKTCRYGIECYHDKNKVCEFKHVQVDLVDVTFAMDDNQKTKTH